ncbi:class II 3-deoxy-7-phosphoheptulonate synthase [Demequina sp. SO4-18]|uniref:class II 3-deoxy-7-phosphoheptulonate synthase n=1 Tax=Demequina sp. SO4-18 TaxID=3401026 RepID=UPI003B596AB8
MTEAALEAAGVDSYLQCEAKQQPEWPDRQALERTTERLRQVPPLVFAGEADVLRDHLAAAGRGEAFVLQGGDCAEIFAEATADRIRNKIKTILQMAVILTYGASTPVVKIGRMAGQYAKPRSAGTETRDGVTLPTYRGDIVNSSAFTEEARIPNPERLVDAYHVSAATLNLIRAFTHGGFADLRRVHAWNKGFAANPAYARYDQMAAQIDRAVRFMGAAGGDFDALKTVDLFSSHEALLLDYERALTRIDSRSGLPYDCSAHFLWVGERTRELDGAHVEFMSRIHNPIGVKLGPTATGADAVALAERLNPDNVPGRLTFVARMGADKVRDALPPIVEAVRDAGVSVTWLTDPMHGNTFTSESGYKTRRFDTILDEVTGFFEVHRAAGTIPGGMHVELTGDDVTEVMGGTEDIDDEGLARRYETKVDPRLNHQQSLELAFQVSELLSER